MERAREVDDRGQKRSANVDAGELRTLDQAGAQFETASAPPTVGASSGAFQAGDNSMHDTSEVVKFSDVNEVTRQQLMEWAIGEAQQHPLLQVQSLAALDRLDPELGAIHDHGSWDGRWQLPTRSQWEVKEALGQTWPCGKVEYEAQAVQAARKEYSWSNMNADEKVAFRKACEDGWSVWADNGAVEISKEESAKVIRDLKRRGETTKLLRPRWVMTDKNDGLCTANRDLPLRANSRLVVPGYQDESAYGLRKDAPTGSVVWWRRSGKTEFA